ncbi:hypothetical protein INT48_005734 [Thamnidium elegans]|uniref:BZIP domain-containing protein n=1 Tax=Thamnidium elegans TaxID=101142 RepID=A0A8H7STP8_9FUNG|nr:hypothetical protein INT48_005734 [Thamnidium elegans]
MSIIQTPALESTTLMDQDVFSQLYQSLTPTMGTPFHEPSSVFDEWLKQDFLSPECSIHSSPEINTPLDQFLMSPPFQSKDDLSLGCSFTDKDLDVSAILDSPAPQLGYPSANTLQMSAPMTNLFADIGESLPAALAALAAVAAAPTAPTAPVSSTTTATTATTTTELSPAVQSASTPTFSTKTKKRELEIDDPNDDAAVKRQKNTDAARRSRLRKVQKMETLEIRVSELEKINAGLLMRVAVLDSEKTNLKAKEQSYENRIKVLEDQLAEAHKALSSRP